MLRSNSKKDNNRSKKPETNVGAAVTPDRTPSVKQLLQRLEKQEKDHNKQFQEMRSFYEEKLIRFDAMQVRYMASREQQETLISRIKKLEKDLIDMQSKKELADAELNKQKDNIKSALSITEKLKDRMDECDAVKWIERDKEFHDIREHCACLEKGLAVANGLVTERDEAIAEFQKRIDALRRLTRKLPSDKNENPPHSSKAYKKHVSRQDENSDSDSELSELLVIIDEVKDEKGITVGNKNDENQMENLHAAHYQSNGGEQADSFQKRKKAIERKLDEITSSIEAMQRKLLLTIAELKTKLVSECVLQRRIEKLQLTNEKLKGKCEQLGVIAVEKPLCEVKKLAERLRDLEAISENAAKSFEMSTNAFVRLDNQKNEYKEIISSSIGEIDKLCTMVKHYLETGRTTPNRCVKDDTDTSMEAKHHWDEISSLSSHPKLAIKLPKNSTSSTKPSEVSTNFNKSHQSSSLATMQNSSTADNILPALPIAPLVDGLSGSSGSGHNNTDSSFASDCSLITLDKTCFIETDNSPQSELFKEPLQTQRQIASNTATVSKQRDEAGVEWLSSKGSSDKKT